MLLIFYKLIVFIVVEFVKMKDSKVTIGRKIFQKFGKILRVKRQEKRLTQEELANLADIHRTYIAGIERGFRNPSLKNIIRLSKALKIDPKELFP